MAYQYKRRRPSLIRNFWVYRRLIGVAALLGLMLWFVWANDAAVTVAFPFRLGTYQSTLGVIILLSALCGALLALLGMTVFVALRKIRGEQAPVDQTEAGDPDDDRPPPDYASKTEEGFRNNPW